MWEKSTSFMMINVSIGMILILVAFLLLVTHKVSIIIDDTISDINVIESDINK